MDIRKLISSFSHAHAGIIKSFRTEQNLRIHGIVGIVVVALGLWLGLVSWEWVSLFICIGLVIGAELFNTSIEHLADRVTTEKDPLIKHAKDSAAGAVQVFAILAVAVGLVVLLPKLVEKVSS